MIIYLSTIMIVAGLLAIVANANSWCGIGGVLAAIGGGILKFSTYDLPVYMQ